MTDPTPQPVKDKRIDYKVWAGTAAAAGWAAADLIIAAVEDNPALSDGPAWWKWFLPVLVFGVSYWKKSQRVAS